MFVLGSGTLNSSDVDIEALLRDSDADTEDSTSQMILGP